MTFPRIRWVVRGRFHCKDPGWYQLGAHRWRWLARLHAWWHERLSATSMGTAWVVPMLLPAVSAEDGAP